MGTFFETYGMPQKLTRTELVKEYERLKAEANGNPEAEHIDHYLTLGFKRVCTIKSTRIGNYWYYEDIDKTLMFNEHRSWVYAITRHGRIIKFGESGNPLGIEMKDGQPKLGTQCRFGRYRKGGGTDESIRDMYRRETQESFKVMEVYALQCPEIDHKLTIVNEEKVIKAQIHKQLEKTLLDYFKENTGSYPAANCGRY